MQIQSVSPMLNTSQGQNIRPKWNSILKTDEDGERMGVGKGSGVGGELQQIRPEVQPNRSRSESVPELSSQNSMKVETSMLLSPLSVSEAASLAKMLEVTFWDDPTGTNSPLRSPMATDWKVVGSPIDQGGSIDESLFENNLSLLPNNTGVAVNVNDTSSPEKKRLRRPRAMSLIERGGFGTLNFSPFTTELIELKEDSMTNNNHRNSVGKSQLSTPEKGNDSMTDNATGEGVDGVPLSCSQVAQLPTSLHEELGFENADEATEIFKRSSMDSLSSIRGIRMSTGEGGSPVKPLSAMPSFFARMPFGPAAMVFGSDSVPNAQSPSNNIEEFNDGGNDGCKSTDTISRRHSSIFGVPEWPEVTTEFSIDDYFANGSMKKNANVPFVPPSRYPRRHSIAATGLFPEVEEHFGSLSLSNNESSTLSPSAASFNFKGYGPVDYNMMGGGDSCMDSSFMNSSISAANMRDATFQLSTYKGPLYAIEFKAGRTEIFFVLEIDGKPQLTVRVGDLVIVEADRGEDLGKVTIEITVAKLKQLMMPGFSKTANADKDSDILTPEMAALVHSREIVPKRIHRLAQSSDLKLLQAKAQEEAIAMVRCQSRIRQKKLPMEVVDAEYQWDRNKLTFYFCADRRIDFRELVRDLFRIYKTRIWMCAVDKSSPRMLMYCTAAGSASDSTLPTYYSLGPSRPHHPTLA